MATDAAFVLLLFFGRGTAGEAGGEDVSICPQAAITSDVKRVGNKETVEAFWDAFTGNEGAQGK